MSHLYAVEGETNRIVTQPMNAAATEPQVLPVPEAVGRLVGSEEKPNFFIASEGNGGLSVDFGAKRKRGRPRKLTPVVEVRMAASESSASPQRKGRGRPKGSGKWQKLAASLDGSALDTAGSNFIPHVLRIQMGENIVERVSSYSRAAADSICIVSACGSISRAELVRPSSFGGSIRYEGRFEIVSLTGSYLNNGPRVDDGKTLRLCVQLANPDGSLFGGAVSFSLIAGAPIQLVLATFTEGLREQVRERRRNIVPPERANGQSPEVKANVVTTVSEAAAVAEGVEKQTNGSVVNHARPHHQPFDWSSLEASGSLAPFVSDFHT